jgi:hypothetical protein
MRTSDLARLSEPYSEDDNSTRRGPQSALGLDLLGWSDLEATILDDFVDEPPYGVGWWAPGPGARRRILISDQLYACVESVLTNMVEAALHLLEFVDFADRDSDRYADAIKVEGGQVTWSPPLPLSPLDDLSPELMRIHVAGMVRALSAALDCFAGTVVGVVAIPTSILKADLQKVRHWLNGSIDSATDGFEVQAQFAAQLESIIASSGPEGWLDWATDFRNMLVHRGRRLEHGQFVRKIPTLYGADGQPIQRARRVTHLPRDPGRSDVEVLLDPVEKMVLTEDAAQTLTGLLNSTKSLINSAGEALTEIWNWRRDNPRSLRQPVAQWRDGPAPGSLKFAGYSPGTFEFSPTMLMSHPVVEHRLRCAALDDASRWQWAAFD